MITETIQSFINSDTNKKKFTREYHLINSVIFTIIILYIRFNTIPIRDLTKKLIGKKRK
jgi:hypothetical protein